MVRATLAASLQLLLLLLPLAASSGCTLLWLFNSSEEGLPCELSDDAPEGKCLDGYTCIVENDAPVCKKAKSLKKGASCARSDQCESGLVCGSGYAPCETDDGRDDINCALATDNDKALQCREACDINNPTGCGEGERCFSVVNDESGASGLCAPGTCATDTDCAEEDALCAGAFDSGKTGLCLERCSPLTCRVNGVCDGCDGQDGVLDEGLNCVPVPGFALQADRYVCDAGGTLLDFDACGSLNAELCQLGSFCVAVPEGSYCAPWCSVSGGNPGCADGTSCQQLDAVVGFCQ